MIIKIGEYLKGPLKISQALRDRMITQYLNGAAIKHLASLYGLTWAQVRAAIVNGRNVEELMEQLGITEAHAKWLKRTDRF